MLIDKGKVKNIFETRNLSFTDIIIILDTVCNADCKLCVAKHIIKNSNCKDTCNGFKLECLKCCGRIAEDKIFYTEVEDILTSLHGKNVRVTLSGGEPTISKRLISTLEILDKYNFMELAIETNGTGLLNESVSAELLKRNVNIILSRYGITDEENNAEFDFKFGAVSAKSVKEIIQLYKDKITVSCIPLKNAVNSADKLIEFYDYYIELGANDVVFSEAMFDTNLATANKDISKYYEENVIRISELSKGLVKLGHKKTFESDGAFKVIRHKYGNNHLTLMAADMSKIATEVHNDNKYSRYLIYPSGEIGTNYVED